MYSIQASDSYKHKITSGIFSLIRDLPSLPVILCIGSKNDSDSLGPITGDMLIYRYNIRTYVYGCQKRPVTADNVINTYEYIKKTHRAKVLVIDTVWGGQSNIINIYQGGIRPASASFKDLSRVGDFSLTCGGIEEENFLARQNLQKLLAANIAGGINDAFILLNACLKNNIPGKMII